MVVKVIKFVIEGTLSLWKEFVWPYYGYREECCVGGVEGVWTTYQSVIFA